MLQTIRENSQGVIAKVIIGLIIGVFALFGVESIVGGFLASNNAASVNGEDISQQQLEIAVQNLMAQMGADLENFDEELLRDVALNQLIEDILLKQAADNAGMVVSSDSVDRAILRSSQFQINGVFDEDLARRTMASQGYTPQTYRATLSERMLLGQLVNAYASSAFATDADIARIAELQAQTRDFRYISVPLGTRSLGEAIPPEEIQAYYDNNQDEFTSEEQVSVRYVMLDKEDIFDDVEVDEQRVREQYEAERAEAESDIERRVSHILLEITGDSNESEVVEQAASIKARLDEGEEFGELAREFSDDVVSAEDDGDIGYTDGSVFPDAVEEALLTLEVGEVSDPVVSEFGVHLVKLTEYNVQEYPEFEEAADNIARDLKQADVDQLYFERLEILANLAFETFDLQAISDELGVEIQESDFFGRQGGFEGVTSEPAVVEQAFSDQILLDDLNSDVIELSETQALVLHLAEHRPASVRPLEEVRPEIAVTLRTQREEEMARELGESVLSELEAGNDASEILETESLTWAEHENVSRNQFDLNTEIVQTVFSLSAPASGEVVRHGWTLNNGAYVVLELQAVNPGSLEDLSEEERGQLVAAMQEGRGRAAFTSLLGNLQSEADIER